MTQIQFPALSPDDAARLRTALGSGDLTVFADGTAVRLPKQVRDGVVQILSVLAEGQAVEAFAGDSRAILEALHPEKGVNPDVSRGTSQTGMVSAPTGLPSSAALPAYTGPEFLTTSQAAAAAGISLTYMRNLANAGEIPVEYRGTHRRFRGADVMAWVEANHAKREQKPQGSDEVDRKSRA